MEDMYGRANPKPKPPEFDAEDMRRMKAREETDLLAVRADEAATLEDKSVLYYDSFAIERNLGEDCGGYKWRQTQTFVEIFVPLPANCVVSQRRSSGPSIQLFVNRSRRGAADQRRAALAGQGGGVHVDRRRRCPRDVAAEA
jgi:hypothetical protein